MALPGDANDLLSHQKRPDTLAGLPDQLFLVFLFGQSGQEGTSSEVSDTFIPPAAASLLLSLPRPTPFPGFPSPVTDGVQF